MQSNRFIYVEFISVSVAILTLIYLGVWQLTRLEEKNSLINRLKNGIYASPISYSSSKMPELFSKIKLEGHFLSNKDIHLYGRKTGRPEKDGYYLLSPFQTVEGDIILVSRGWFARSNKGLVNNIHNLHHEEIIGLTRESEEKGFFIPRNDLKGNVWLTLNIDEASKYLDLKLQNFYLVEIREKSILPGIIILPHPEILMNIRNDHLEYAITWFLLAGALFIIYQIKNFRARRRKA